MCAKKIKKCSKLLRCKEVAKEWVKEAIKKSIEGIFIALIIGASLKLFLVVPVVASGAAIGKIAAGRMIQ